MQERTFQIILICATYLVVSQCNFCRDSNLCCHGRDSSCVVQKAPINSISGEIFEKPCYCDHACLKLDDCCTDFKQYCGGKHSLHLPNSREREIHIAFDFRK